MAAIDIIEQVGIHCDPKTFVMLCAASKEYNDQPRYQYALRRLREDMFMEHAHDIIKPTTLTTPKELKMYMKCVMKFIIKNLYVLKNEEFGGALIGVVTQKMQCEPLLVSEKRRRYYMGMLKKHLPYM